MPRYMVERDFPGGFPAVESDRQTHGRIAAINSHLGVVWITSFVSDDRRRSFCVCEAPSPEAIRRAAGRYHWPIDAITKVSVVEPRGDVQSENGASWEPARRQASTWHATGPKEGARVNRPAFPGDSEPS